MAVKKENKLEKFFRFLIYLLPGVLIFSYFPLIHFGADAAMNYEISLPLIWLVVFDVVAVVLMAKRKILLKNWRKNWAWVLLPIFLTLSVLWSLNSVRGLLTVGILWLLYLAGYGFFGLKSLFNEVGLKEKFWKCFFGAALLICFWCVLQCVLDLVGVSRDYSLMCAGCTYSMFGFPRPNGFAIEPQFMGNLLLAPAVMSAYFALKNKKYWVLFFVFVATLFLTMSRGAILAFLMALVVLTIVEIVKTKRWRAMMLWPMVILAFLLTLNVQGLMAEVSKTDDTYVTGVEKVINNLSLGLISFDSTEVDEESVESGALQEEKEEAAFGGYVAESTDTRVKLSSAALKVWSKDFATVMFGVGLGGAGQALYANGLSDSPKEIVQNEYVSLLLETGIVGVGLLIFTLVLVFKVIVKSKMRAPILTLIVAYGVSLLFFSGFVNALQILLLPIAILAIGRKTEIRYV